MEPGKEVLLEAHEQTEGPDLPTVCVSGELQIDATLGGPLHRARLVHEQDGHAISIAPRQRAIEILSVSRNAAARGGAVIDPYQIKSGAFVFDRHALISQYPDAKTRQLLNPLRRA